MKPKKEKQSGCGLLEEFDAAARAAGLTYAQAQMAETCRLYQKRRPLPPQNKKTQKRGL